MPRKIRPKKKVQSESNNKTKDKVLNKKDSDKPEESWHLDKVLPLEELSNEHVIMCKNDLSFKSVDDMQR